MPRREDAIRKTLAGAITITATAAIALLVLGCGGGGSSTTTTSTTSTEASASLCAAYTQVKSAGSSLKQLSPGSTSAAQVEQAATQLNDRVEALSSAASQAGGQVESSVKAAVSSFQTKVYSAAGQPVSQQLVTVGTALNQLETSLSTTVSQLHC
jgi:hypothetical protein